MSRVLVTGASGFIGRETLPFLRAGGHDIHVLARSAREAVDGVTHHRCDLIRDDPTPVLAGIGATHLLHLAWYAEPGRFWDAPANLDWVAASLRLVRAFAATGGGRLVVAGSCAEYDWSAPLLDESATPLGPATLYGEAKAALFRLLDKAAPALGLSFAWGRIFFPFGPFEPSGRLLGDLFDAIARGDAVPLSAGTQQRDFIHVEDVADALVRLLGSPLEGPVNIASGQALAVRDLAASAARIAGGADLIRFGERPARPGEPPVMAAATRRLHEELGFTPRYTTDSGLQDMFRRRPSDRRPS